MRSGDARADVAKNNPSWEQSRVRSRENAAETRAGGGVKAAETQHEARFRPQLRSSAAKQAKQGGGKKKKKKKKWGGEVGGGGVDLGARAPTNYSSVDALAREGVIHSPRISAVPVVTVVSHFIVLRDLAHTNTLPSTRDVKNVDSDGRRCERGREEFAKRKKKTNQQ